MRDSSRPGVNGASISRRLRPVSAAMKAAEATTATSSTDQGAQRSRGFDAMHTRYQTPAAANPAGTPSRGTIRPRFLETCFMFVPLSWGAKPLVGGGCAGADVFRRAQWNAN